MEAASVTTALVWFIAAGTIAGVLFRPKDWPEAVWAVLGAFVLVISGLLPLSQAGVAIGKGTDVYLFLTGMMLLSETIIQPHLSGGNCGDGVPVERRHGRGADPRGLRGGSQGSNKGSPLPL